MYLCTIGNDFFGYESPKGANICSASGRRSSKRVSVEDLGNNRHQSPCMSCQPRWLSGLRRSRVHSLVIARRSLCPEKLGSNPGQGSKGINFSGWHGLDMSITVTKRR